MAKLPLATGGFIEIPWQRLEYAYKPAPDKGDGTILVFLHEGLGCVDMWRARPSPSTASRRSPTEGSPIG